MRVACVGMHAAVVGRLFERVMGSMKIVSVLSGILIGVVLLGASVAAKAQTPGDLERAERMGQQLYQLDRAFNAANVAGQDTRAFRRSDEITGWVSGQRDGDVWLTFVGESKKQGPIALFQMAISAAGTPVGEMQRLDEEPLSGELLVQYSARKRAEALPHTQCATQTDTLLIPETTPAGTVWQAYVLPHSAFGDVLMLGGSVRVTVAADGARVDASQALGGEACTVVQNPADAPALQVSEGTQGGPNELHVYLSLRAGKPLYVIDGERRWLVQDGHVRAVPNG